MLIKIIKRQLKFLERIIRKEGFKNLTHIEHIEGERDRGRQRTIYLCELTAESGGGGEEKKHNAKGHEVGSGGEP